MLWLCLFWLHWGPWFTYGVLGQFPEGLFPDGQFPKDISPTGSSPNGQLTERTFPWRTVPRMTFPRIIIYRWYMKVAEANEFQQNWIAELLNCWNPLEITSEKFSLNFKAPLIRSSFLAALQTVDGKPKVASPNFWKSYSSKQTDARVVKWRNFSCYLTKMRLYALPAILKFLGTRTLSICGGVSFISRWIGQLELPTRNSTRDVFLETFFQTFQNSSFSEHPLKNVWSNFSEAFSF